MSALTELLQHLLEHQLQGAPLVDGLYSVSLPA